MVSLGVSRLCLQVQDLLKPANENLQIREGSNGVFVSGVEEQPVGSMHDCLRLMQLGDRNRQDRKVQKTNEQTINALLTEKANGINHVQKGAKLLRQRGDFIS